MTTIPTNNDEQLREAVRECYGRTALEVLAADEPKAASCCGPDCCSTSKGNSDAVTSDLDSNTELVSYRWQKLESHWIDRMADMTA